MDTQKFKYTLHRRTLEKLYTCYIRPILEYASPVWDNCSNELSDSLERIQYEAARLVTGATRSISREKLLSEAGWETLAKRREK